MGPCAGMFRHGHLHAAEGHLSARCVMPLDFGCHRAGACRREDNRHTLADAAIACCSAKKSRLYLTRSSRKLSLSVICRGRLQCDVPKQLGQSYAKLIRGGLGGDDIGGQRRNFQVELAQALGQACA